MDYEIPLNYGNQKFNIRLGSAQFKLQLIYRASQWYLDIFDTAENPLIAGLPMLVGDNLLAQYQHIIKGSLYVFNINEDESQAFSDLSTNIKLYWSDI
ncbi:phage baseplate plug family protein [Acinetobacter guillouiae]|uniref:phage baseplate plug family protein n=1 Tax=Acinetobacter guillouiae TaxID=106649 RepID=UPI003C705CF0